MSEMGAMRRLGASAGLSLGLGLGLALGLGGACSKVDSTTLERCRSLCDSLAVCGMLPSPLGLAQTGRSALSDCIDRCALSDDTREQIQTCISPTGDEETGTNQCPLTPAWGPGGSCSRTASCMRKLYNDQILGNGTVELGWREADVSEFNVEVTQCGDPADCMSTIDTSCAEDPKSCAGIARACPQAAQLGEISDDTASAVCNLNYRVVESVVYDADGVFMGVNAADFTPSNAIVALESSRGMIEIARGPCDEVIGRSYVVEDVPVGVYRVAVEFGGGPGEVPGCAKYYGTAILVTSGATVQTEAKVPGSVDAGVLVFGCEDCSSSDRDNDGLKACQDPDCFDHPDCTTGTTDTGTTGAGTTGTGTTDTGTTGGTDTTGTTGTGTDTTTG